MEFQCRQMLISTTNRALVLKASFYFLVLQLNEVHFNENKVIP